MTFSRRQFFFTIVLLLICVTSLASAFSVSSVTATPSGQVSSGTAMAVSYNVEFPTSNGNTFPSGHTFLMSTDLVNPKWSYIIGVDGVNNPPIESTDNTVTLGIFHLSYVNHNAALVTVTLSGIVPSGSSQSLLKLQEKDEEHNVISSTVYNQAIPVATVSTTVPSTVPTTVPTTTPITTVTTVLTTTKPTTVATTIQTTIPTTIMTTIPITTTSTPTKKPTTIKTFTPYPTNTPTQESPIGIEICLLAVGFAALVLTVRR